MLEFELTLNNVEYLQIAFHHAAPVFAKVGRSCRVLRPMFSDTPNVTERTKNGAVCATCRYMGQDGKCTSMPRLYTFQISRIKWGSHASFVVALL